MFKCKKLYFEFVLEMTKYVYDGKVSGKILIVGESGCGKTMFVQKINYK